MRSASEKSKKNQGTIKKAPAMPKPTFLPVLFCLGNKIGNFGLVVH